jgi:creatinine amidohydrolase/Fe(II)-dependent formamide hydrolase-like protein
MRQVAQSAAAAGFKNIFLMGDHGGGQSELRLAAESVDADWRAKGVRVYYVSDVNTKAGERVNAYLKEHGIVGGGHAAVAETAQVMFLDQTKSLIHPDKFAVSAAGPEATTGVGGNPSAATIDMGRQFIEYKVAAGVEQIRALLAQK